MRSRRGTALIAALWLVVAIGVVALEFGLWARSRRLAAANILEEMRAHAAAHAGLDHARSRLSRMVARTQLLGLPPGPASDPWARVDTMFAGPQAVGATQYRIRIEDAAASLHLNHASEEELVRFFAALGAAQPDRIAQAVADWRDTDDAPHPLGAERGDYLSAGRRVLPRNSDIDRLAELRHIEGMTERLYQRALPHITLLGSGEINLNTASGPVLLALRGMTHAAVAAAIRRRAAGQPLVSVLDLAVELPPGPRRALELEAPYLSARTRLEATEVEVRVSAWADGSPVTSTAQTLITRADGTVRELWRRIE